MTSKNTSELKNIFAELPLRGCAAFGKLHVGLIGVLKGNQRQSNVIRKINLSDIGYKWGEDSPGCNDLAINCCHALMPPLNNDTDVVFNGVTISLNTHTLYNKFKETFLLPLDKDKSFFFPYIEIHSWMLDNKGNWLTKLAHQSSKLNSEYIIPGVKKSDLNT